MGVDKQTARTVADHLRHILDRISHLEDTAAALSNGDLSRRFEAIEARLEAVEQSREFIVASRPESSSEGTAVDNETLAQVVELEHRLQQVEKENEELQSLCDQLREHHEAISNLYVAKHRLHASLDAGEIMSIIQEILLELVGAVEFAIFFLDRRTKTLRRVAGRGAERAADPVQLGEGLLGRVASLGKPFYFEPESDFEEPDGAPLAVIPLKADEKTVGLIAIYRLLGHKPAFTPIDHQLLESVAEHAPNAIMSARLRRLGKTE